MTKKAPTPTAAFKEVLYPREAELQSQEFIDPKEFERLRRAFDEGQAGLRDGRVVVVATPMQHAIAVGTIQGIVDPYLDNPNLQDVAWGKQTAIALQDTLEDIQKKNGLPITGRYDGSDKIRAALTKEYGDQSPDVIEALDTLKAEGLLRKHYPHSAHDRAVEAVQRFAAPYTNNPKLKDGDWGSETKEALTDKIKSVQEMNGLEVTGRYDGSKELKAAILVPYRDGMALHSPAEGEKVIEALDQLKKEGLFHSPRPQAKPTSQPS